MSKDISVLLDELIAREGGYSDHPADTGGPTMYGITEHVARAHGYTGHMQDLPKQMAKNIYNDIYWVEPAFNQVALRYPAVAEELFDTGVNMGPVVASTMLQKALNVLNRGKLYYPDLVADGRLGKMTMYALDQYRKNRPKGEGVLLKLLNAQQAVRYMNIAEAKPSQEEFMYGWVENRVQ